MNFSQFLESVDKDSIMRAASGACDANLSMNCRLFVQLTTGDPEIDSYPEVSVGDVRVGDVLAWGRQDGDYFQWGHYAIYLGGDEVLEVPGWNKPAQVSKFVFPKSMSLKGYGRPAKIVRPRWNTNEALNLPDYVPDETEHSHMQTAIRDMVEEEGVDLQSLIDYFKPKLRELYDFLVINEKNPYGLFYSGSLNSINKILFIKNANQTPEKSLLVFYDNIKELKSRLDNGLKLLVRLSNSPTPERAKLRTQHKWYVLHALQVVEFLQRKDIRDAFEMASRNSRPTY